MDIDNNGQIYCADDDECHICDNLAIDRYSNNHLKSQIHKKKFRKRQQLNNPISSEKHCLNDLLLHNM